MMEELSVCVHSVMITPCTKHMDAKYHFIKETEHKGLIELKYCTTEEMLADIFIIAVSETKHYILKVLLLSSRPFMVQAKQIQNVLPGSVLNNLKPKTLSDVLDIEIVVFRTSL